MDLGVTDAAETSGLPSDPGFPAPIFVGGTGRSGTTVLGRLIGNHSRYHMIPAEVRFHAVSLPRLLAGHVDLETFLAELRPIQELMKDVPWDRNANRFHLICSRRSFDHAIALFEEGWSDDPLGSSRRLVRSLLDPMAEKEGKPAWVEMSPPNVTAASTLSKLFPCMKLIHTVRDGRDAASSVVGERWGPNSVKDGIARWGKILRRADAAAKDAPEGSVLIMQLEELISESRAESYDRLLAFLELPDEPDVRSFFDGWMTAERAHIGRWRDGLSQVEQQEVDAVYRQELDSLHGEGLTCVPAP